MLSEHCHKTVDKVYQNVSSCQEKTELTDRQWKHWL